MPDRLSSARERAHQFIETGAQFRLGALPTECPDPRSKDLAATARQNLPAAIELFREFEQSALEMLLQHGAGAEELVKAMNRVLSFGGRIFLCGCGATGRLALVLETIWRGQGTSVVGKADSIVAFTAGGDFALVRSLGIFEDKAELGAKHLLDLGFREGDLLLGITEGGETSFVLGAIEKASQKSREKAWLLCCNPLDLLSRTTERSKVAIENPRVRALALETGPMILAGSTRLQASSVLMAFVGACLREVASQEKYTWTISQLLDRFANLNLSPCAELIEWEAAVHENGAHTLHRSRTAAIGVLTDTTERAPTFSLIPFENSADPSAPLSKTYLEVPHSFDSANAWQLILRRAPRPFYPPRTVHPTSAPPIDMQAILGFDFSDGLEARRNRRGAKTTLIIEIDLEKDCLAFVYRAPKKDRSTVSYVAATGDDPLIQQLMMKSLLNLQSTLAMGRLGRYHGNLMTYVRPANNKLIDRSVRTLRAYAAAQADSSIDSAIDLKKKTTLAWIANEAADETLLEAVFLALSMTGPDEPVVLSALRILQTKPLET